MPARHSCQNKSPLPRFEHSLPTTVATGTKPSLMLARYHGAVDVISSAAAHCA